MADRVGACLAFLRLYGGQAGFRGASSDAPAYRPGAACYYHVLRVGLLAAARAFGVGGADRSAAIVLARRASRRFTAVNVRVCGPVG